VTTFFLVRHAVHNLGSGVIAGRKPGVSLSETGRAQAELLAERLRREAVTALYTSPRQRTLETSELIAARCKTAVEICAELDEVDFGDWTGHAIEKLEGDTRWAVWNRERDSASTPGGETMQDVASRVISLIEHARARNPDGRIVLVSHAELIRTAVLYYLGLPFSAFSRIEIDPASISRLVIGDWGGKLAGLNETVAP